MASEAPPEIKRRGRTAGRDRADGRSWIDALLDALERLPGPTPAAYAIVAVALLLAKQVAMWIDGIVPVGTVHAGRVAEVILLIGLLAFIHALRITARTSLASFRPALDLTDAELRGSELELTTLPPLVALAASAAGTALASVSVAMDQGSYLGDGAGPLVTIVSVVSACFTSSLLIAGLVFIVRQGRTVRRLYGAVEHVDLYHQAPIQSFSRLTATAAIGIIALGAFGWVAVVVVWSPDLPPNIVDVGTVTAAWAIALVAFVAPLSAMHDRLAEQKEVLVAEASGVVELAQAHLRARVMAGDEAGLTEARNGLEGAISGLAFVHRLPTWPWSQETLRAIVTALALPIVIWLVTSLLDRVLG